MRPLSVLDVCECDEDSECESDYEGVHSGVSPSMSTFRGSVGSSR